MEKIDQISWLWVVFAGGLGITLIHVGIKQAQSFSETKDDTAHLSKKEKFAKHLIDWNVFPLSDEAWAWRNLGLGFSILFGAFIVALLKLFIPACLQCQ
jgi:hypothetical protein